MTEPTNAKAGEGASSVPPDSSEPAAAAAPRVASTAIAQPAATAVATPRSTAVSTEVKPPPMPPLSVLDPAHWSATGPVMTGILTIVLLIGGFVGWGMFSTIAGAIVAPGVVQVEQNRQVVQHPDGGVVAEIDVVEAQNVKAGDLLIRLDGAQLTSTLAIIEGQLWDSTARRSRLEAERDDKPAPVFTAELLDLAKTRPDVADQIEGQRRLFSARLETLNAQIDQLQQRRDQLSAQVDGIKAQTAAISDQVNLLTPEIGDQQKLLDKGLTQSSRLMDLKREAARLQGNMGEMKGNQAQAEGKATEIQLQILQLRAARREDANTQLRDMGDKTLELAERRRALTEQIARLDIRAPVSGIVLGLQVTTLHSVIRAAEPVLYIIPQDRPLIIVAQLPPIHVDEVFVGQEVRVVFTAFQARTTPQLNGHLTTISADAINDPASKASFYRAEIVLDPGEIDKLHGQTILPGMPVQAYIGTGDRSPMAYLLKPFMDYFHMAFRES